MGVSEEVCWHTEICSLPTLSDLISVPTDAKAGGPCSISPNPQFQYIEMGSFMGSHRGLDAVVPAVLPSTLG